MRAKNNPYEFLSTAKDLVHLFCAPLIAAETYVCIADSYTDSVMLCVCCINFQGRLFTIVENASIFCLPGAMLRRSALL